jgi:RNA polymerase sigma factor (sigma-70 family)
MPNFPQSNNALDLQLWQQLKLGSELALGKLIKKYFNFLQNYGFKFVKDEAFVQDCVQEVFIEIWTRRDKVVLPNSVRAYLLSSVRRRVLREKERQHIKDNSESYNIDLEPDSICFSHEWLLTEQESLNELSKQVSDLLNKLPKRQREVLYLRFYQNLERAEIAQIMDINEQSVSNHLQAAFKNFKGSWQGFGFIVYCLLKKFF